MAVVKVTDLTEDKLEGECGLLKIPAEALLKQANQKIGELQSYIDELEYDRDQLMKIVDQYKDSIDTTMKSLVASQSLAEHLGARKKLYKRALKNILKAICNNNTYEDVVKYAAMGIRDLDLHDMDKEISQL